ncbi:MAG: beta-ketoacyl-[acyl-carrier-protein] synthase II [Candidatus Abyssobacteria bacterium SURF_17]|uniref:3-oxoacyl-[acyl-carrier-protein] synthase 2 n=1 Tax=Candidatus Abyssobacteria bacterium SURF_17 TaxID=2093361 RepID=A0A419ET64_9BACT|nr:MAG: beta-ketoacyl-[acyl-carrier-protein] synthase II [Candidatus Abyssubacteria bacterium SURF_17]
MLRRVVITGAGVISPVGNTLEKFWDSLKVGRSGVKRLTHFDTSEYSSKVAGTVEDFKPDEYFSSKEIKRSDRFAQFALAASKMALVHSGIELDKMDRDRAGVLIGSGIGGIATMGEQHATFIERGQRRISPFAIPMLIINMASGIVAMSFGLKGPNTAVSTACATGSHAIGDAYRIIERDEADAMLAGGSEAALTDFGFGAFCAMRALTTSRNDEPERASRPFDRLRDGFVMSEGAGVIVLEEMEHARTRGANILGEIIGYGMSADAYHITAPSPDGEGAARAMRAGLKSARLAPEAISYINAHGTSTPLNDKLETDAVKAVFGDHARKLAISSTKSHMGHLLGAAGGVEAIATLFAMQESVVPPTINYEEPDPECDLDYVPNVAREMNVEYAMSNSFGFGGTNATLVFKRYQ